MVVKTGDMHLFNGLLVSCPVSGARGSSTETVQQCGELGFAITWGYRQDVDTTLQHVFRLIELDLNTGQHPKHPSVPRLDGETEPDDPAGPGGRHQRIEEDATQPPSLKAVYNGYGDLGVRPIAGDVTP